MNGETGIQRYGIKEESGVDVKSLNTWYDSARTRVGKLTSQPSTLRKHAYSNILKLLLPKTENFQIKNSDIFHISAQNIDCGYSLEPPHRCLNLVFFIYCTLIAKKKKKINK